MVLSDLLKQLINREPSEAAKIAELCDSTSAALTKLSQDYAGEHSFQHACQFLHDSLHLRDHGADPETGVKLRSHMFERFGLPIMHALLSVNEMQANENASDTLEAVGRTLTSVVDDADKLAHIKDLLESYHGKN